MKGLRYQLKSIGRDKMCILTFLLPLVVGIALRLLSGASFQTMGEASFGVLDGGLPADAAAWLRENGSVTRYADLDELRQAVNDPSTQMIGVLWDGNGLRTLRAGDEREVDRVMADTLPQLYAGRAAQTAQVEIAAPMAPDDGLRALLVALTLVTAMFMGCTFNAMNIISEKEDGIEFINRVLPMTARTYVVQKTLVGFAGGAASTLAAAAVCMRVPGARVLPFLLIVALSAYIAALLGLFIGRFSSGLMVGVVYIKITMILFLAPPVVFYLLAPPDSVLFGLSYLLPSSATFYAVMDLLNGQTEHLRPALAALAAHALVWSAAYRCLRRAGG